MIRSLGRFAHYLNESRKDFQSSSKIYSLYIVFFIMISIVQTIADTYIPQKQWWPRVLSQFLFSGIPILVLSKILYIVKVRMDGTAEYKEVLAKNILYSSYYFCMAMLAALIYPLSVLLMLEINFTDNVTALILGMPLLAPFFYVVMFYSLSPLVAVFEERGPVETFKRSRELTRKDILLVFINHLCALVIPSLFGLVLYVADLKWKFGLRVLLSIPEAILTIVFLLTTIKIYTYLSEVED